MLSITISMRTEKKKQKWESFDTEAEAKHRKAEIEYKQGSRTFIAPSKRPLPRSLRIL